MGLPLAKQKKLECEGCVITIDLSKLPILIILSHFVAQTRHIKILLPPDCNNSGNGRDQTT